MAESLAQDEIAEEDRLRASWYSLLARLLSRSADDSLLSVLRGLEGDDTALGSALKALRVAAQGAAPGAIEQEYFDLFIGVGQAELVPYGSYYLTGFLNEKPLAQLRGDMARLGIARADGVKEPEDHLASLCEMMAGLITGALGKPANLATQSAFFSTHIGCWAPRFFEDLQAAESAMFYMPVGMIGSVFMSVESQAFKMAA